jgi:hypothetical protein
MKTATLTLSVIVSCAILLVLCPALKADTFTETYGPTYDFNGAITMTGLIPTCGASPNPCVETIDVSLEYFTDTVNDITNPGFSMETVEILPGSSFSATGALGTESGGGLAAIFNTDSESYIEFHFPVGTSYPNPEIDLLIFPMTNTFSAEEFTCLQECQALFGGGGGIGNVPTTVEYTVTEVPEPRTYILILSGILFLGILRFKARKRGITRYDLSW